MSSPPPRTTPLASIRILSILALATALASVGGCSSRGGTGFARINVGGDDAAVRDVPPRCRDGVMNFGETDVDCGGTASGCAACTNGRRCETKNDCAVGACTRSICQVPLCVNALHDANETGIDCGGPGCPPCDYPSSCAEGRDCLGGVCTGGTCAIPTCKDEVRNQNETATDCGGICAGCAEGQSCGQNSDCRSGVCAASLCAAASCTDGVKNGSETGVDCGGELCSTKCGHGELCLLPSDCAGGVCTNHLCQDQACGNGSKNGTETDVDCGGPCGPCVEGRGCTKETDCLSRVCAVDQKCAAPSCADKLRNGTESDVDCGGSCAPCVTGQLCASGGDCATFSCVNKSCAPATCTDFIHNGDESDVDCGGATSGCPRCGLARTCVVTLDCSGGICMGGECQSPSCSDGTKNGLESDTDCGGGLGCLGCDDGKACRSGKDCVSAVCGTSAPTVCQAASCRDGAKNGSETDTDCGGSCAPALRCPVGNGCRTGGDCVTLVCGSNRTCVAATCADGVMNGDETDADCGGSCPTKCAAGQACGGLGSNCAEGVCTNGFCQVAGCGDMIKNGSETDVDCGGTCARCSDGKSCGGPADCASRICPSNVCVAPSCVDGVKNGSEADVDCGGSCKTRCPPLGQCLMGTDCTSSICTNGSCTTPSCTDTLQNGTESDVDCGGTCPPCGSDKVCLRAADCASGICPSATLKCVAPTCSDQVKNGSESDIDCGGSCAPAKRCVEAQSCKLGSDCASTTCTPAAVCAPGGCQTCWKAQYVSTAVSGDGRWSGEMFDIVSIGTTTVPLSELKLRYWFNSDGITFALPVSCFGFPRGCAASVMTQLVTVSPARPLADRYLEVAFTSQAGILAAGTSAGALSLGFHDVNWTVLNLGNDYSHNLVMNGLADWNQVTLYHNGILVWGVEPPLQ